MKNTQLGLSGRRALICCWGALVSPAHLLVAGAGFALLGAGYALVVVVKVRLVFS